MAGDGRRSAIAPACAQPAHRQRTRATTAARIMTITSSSNLVLAIDTSTPVGSVALGAGNAVLPQAVVGVNARQAEGLLPVIDFVLQRAGVTPPQLGAVVVAGGPGSFTGVRIAAAAAKAFARALDIPL